MDNNHNSKGMDIGGFQNQQVDYLREIQYLKNENDHLKRSVSALELSNRTMNETLLAKQYEIRQLESQIEELRMLYKDSLSARSEYDRYLDTVGQVYSVACESADSIVKRAEKNATKILSDLEHKTDTARENAEMSLRMVKNIREKIVTSFPSLIENIQRTYQEVDTFMAMAASIPQSFDSILVSNQLALKDIQDEVDAYHDRSRALIRDAEQPIQPEDSGVFHQGFSESEPVGSEISASEAAEAPPTEYETLIPQTNSPSIGRPSAEDSADYLRSLICNSNEHVEHDGLYREPEEETADTADDLPLDTQAEQSVSADFQSEQKTQKNYRHKTNVKDLLEKYKNYQIM